MRMLYRAWTTLALIIAGALNVVFADAQESVFEVQPLVVSLPLATQTVDGEGCKVASKLVDPTAKAYAQYLESRFNTLVTLCLFNTIGEAVEAVDETKTNFIWVDKNSIAKPHFSQNRMGVFQDIGVTVVKSNCNGFVGKRRSCFKRVDHILKRYHGMMRF